MRDFQNSKQPDRCVIYCRVSTNNQVHEGSGLETQEALCRQWAHKHGIIVEDLFVDAGKSGKSINNRNELERMVKFLKRAKQPYIVLFFDLQRLSREVTDFGIIRRDIEDSHVQWYLRWKSRGTLNHFYSSGKRSVFQGEKRRTCQGVHDS